MNTRINRNYWLLVFCVLFIAGSVIGCPPSNNDNDDDDDDTPQTVTVPDVVGISQSDAEGNLALVGLTVGTVTQQNSATVPIGDVISQSPLAGRTVDEGSAVDLVISTGPGTPDLTVSPGSVSLSQSALSATVTVSNAGTGTLSWSATANDAAIEVTPSTFTGNSKAVTISTSDFSDSYTALVTFRNDDDAGDTEEVTVTVSGSGSGEVTPGEMVSIPAGSFEMGDPWAEGFWDEHPVHTVSLSAYEIGKYEVTNQEYADVLNWANARGYLDEASSTTADAYGVQLLVVDSTYCQISYSGSEFVVESRDGYSMAEHPVVEVSWYGAAAYCNWLSESQGFQPCYNTSTWECDFSKNGYHLPTEAQWERAAAWDSAQNRHYRYGNGSDSISSDNVNYYDGSYANPLGLSDYPYTSPVGYFSGVTSPAGCFDMSGNVEEWCNDWYDSGYYSQSPELDPHNASTGDYRVCRGGSWRINVWDCRSADRIGGYPPLTYHEVGFRVVCVSSR